MSRVRTACTLMCTLVLAVALFASGCTDSNSEESKPVPPPSTSEYLSGDEPVLLAREQLAQAGEIPIENLIAQITASAVDGEDVWLRVSVENPSTPSAETESVYLWSENEGPWHVVAYGTGIEMGDLAAYGASPATERALFYYESVNEALYEYLDEADEGRWADVHTVRQRYLDLGEDGFWALLDLAFYSNEDRVVLLAVLEWDTEAGDWIVVAHGQDAYSVSEEPPEQLMSGPWTNDFRY